MAGPQSRPVGYDVRVVSASSAGATRPSGAGRAFWWRLTDNLFRRLVWFLLPVAAMGAIGVTQALNTTALYKSSATLRASTNPLLPEQSVSGADARLWETPAAATSRIISDQLSTNAFLTAVAEAAGLGPSIESGLVDLEVVRASVWASSSGDSLLSVNATWADAQTSYQLVESTILEYDRFLAETVASDASEAEEFWTGRLDALEAERLSAEDELADYLADQPALEDNQSYPADVQLRIDRISGNIESIEAQIRQTEGEIDRAVLTRSQQTTQAGESFNVVDEPKVPTAPESTLITQAMLVLSFVLMGAVIAVAALLVTTVLDQSISSTADLASIGSVTQVAVIPPVAMTGRAERRRGVRSRGRPRPAGAR